MYDDAVQQLTNVLGMDQRDTLSRVVLLADACANSGITNVGQISDQVAQLAEADVTTSTYGLVHHFNEELMTAMADAGHGA